MRLLISLLISCVWSCCFCQEKFDTTWNYNKHQFHLSLLINESSKTDLNTKIILYRDNSPILSDSILCSRLAIQFKDLNGDGDKDILIYQSSGARSNETFNLLIYRKSLNDFKKVEKFNQWPNLWTTEIKNILCANILTGSVEYKFFRLENSGRLIDLNISEVDAKLTGKAYKRGLNKVKRLKFE